MQYILTHEEYSGLLQQAEQQAAASKELQDFCTKVSNEMPIKFWGRKEATPWGCILNKDHGMGYCDECPSKKICPHPFKEWSK